MMKKAMALVLPFLLTTQAFGYSRYDALNAKTTKGIVVKGASKYDAKVANKSKRKKVVVFVNNGKLGDVLKMLARTAGIKYVLQNSQLPARNTATATDMAGQSVAISGGDEDVNLYNLAVSINVASYDADTVMQAVCRAADVYCKKDEYGIWHVSKYESYTTDLPVDFDVALTAGGTSGGNGTAGAGDTVNYEQKDAALIEQIKNVLSKEGKIVRSEAGFLTVIDRPSRIEMIKKILVKQQIQSEPLKLSIKVIRVDLNKSNEAGINWSYVFGRNGLFKVTSTFANGITPAMGFAVNNNDIQNLLNVLQHYGNTKIEKEWTVISRGGKPLFFNEVEQVPWVSQEISQGDTTTEIVNQVNYATPGLKIKVIANAYGDEVKGTVYAEVSELLAMQEVTNGTVAPHTSLSNAEIPFDVPFGQSVVISGLTDTKLETVREGLPILSQLPILGALFGHQAKKKINSEVLIVVTPEPLEE